MNGYNSTSSGTNLDPLSDETTRESGQPDQTPEEGQGSDRPREFGGRKKGLEPTRYGDWEKDGRCIDF